MMSPFTIKYNLHALLFVILMVSNTTLLNISSNATWYPDAITVSGSWSAADGSALDRLLSNQGLSIGDDDTLYVADTGNKRVVIIRPNSTTAVATIGITLNSSSSILQRPLDVFVTKNNIYILDEDNEKTLKIWPLNVSYSDGSYRNLQYVINAPGAQYIFVLNDIEIYVSCGYESIVKRFLLDSKIITNETVVAGDGTRGSGPEQLEYAMGIFVDDLRTLYIADSVNHRIQRWNYGATAGVTVAGNGRCDVDSLAQLCSPRSVIVDSNGYIYTVDDTFFRILRWRGQSSIGECIAACSGSRGALANKLLLVFNIAFDHEGSLYASDLYNNRVQKFQIIPNTDQNNNQITTASESNISTTTGSMLVTSKATCLLSFNTEEINLIEITIFTLILSKLL